MSRVMRSGRIWIYAGAAQPEVYSDPRLLAAVTELAGQGTQFKIVTGPILVTDQDDQNPLLKLQKRGVVRGIKHRKFFGFTSPMIAVETPDPDPYDLYEENSLGEILNRTYFADWRWDWCAKMAISRINVTEKESTPHPWLATPELFTQLKEADYGAGSFRYTPIKELLQLPNGSQLRAYQPL